MAFCIIIKKTLENNTHVNYKFYSDGDEGEYSLDKSNFDITIIKPMKTDTHGYILQRAVMKIIRIVNDGGDYPNETMWAS